jgi:ABC-2 type transport system ATP-binding protein
LKILATILKPDEGRLFLFEKDALKDLSYIRKRIAFVPEFPALLEELTVRENLLFFSRLRGVEMESFIVSELMLEPFMGTLVRNASKGVKQRTALAVALSGNPELLILDEPTSGLDVESASIVRSKLKRLKEEGITVIISSHIREDIEELCDEILVINGENRGDSFERDR